jgi:hypothetical protein
MKTVYLFHGIMNDNGKNTTDKLKPFLLDAGFAIREADYGSIAPTNARIVNQAISRMLGGMVDEESYAIGHSNGCALIHLATHQGAYFSKIIYINPALDPNFSPSKLCSKLIVYYSPDDLVVDLAKLALGTVGGNMGRVGYNGADDPRIENVNINTLLAVSKLDNPHNAAFDDRYIDAVSHSIITDFIY